MKTLTHFSSTRRLSPITVLLAASSWTLLGCGSKLDITVQLVDPCNQDAVQSVDYLRFEPRGNDIDSEGLATIQEVGDGATQPITIPLVSDFTLVATGHRGDFNAPPSAIGVSARTDLTAVDDAVSIAAPFALVDSFYKTTSLTQADQCTQLAVGRYGATATYLPESGRVLIVGGAKLAADFLEYPRAVELYDPATGDFHVVAELRSGHARAFHTATRLSDGRVLIAGGEANVQFTQEALVSAFLIDATDPNSVKVSEGGLAMREARTGHTAVLLDDGRVLLAGGRQLNPAATQPQDHTYLDSIEIFDPANGVFTLPTDAQSNAVRLRSARYGHSASILKTGSDILVAGGMNASGPVLGLEVLRLQGNTLTVIDTGETTGVGPIFHAAAVAQNDAVLLSGGYGTIADAEPSGQLPQNPSRDVEMWDFNDANGQISKLCTGSMTAGRGFHTVSMVGRRAVFVGGRDASGVPQNTAEVVTLALGANCFAAPPQPQMMADARAQHAAVLLEGSGEVLVLGGRQQAPAEPFGNSIDGAEIFSPAREP